MKQKAGQPVLVFATNNAHKAREIEQILDGLYRIRTLRDIGCLEEIAETELTLEGNALLKARYVKAQYGYDCFSEDTGLEVDALGGDPGVHTARYAGESKNPAANIALLLSNLTGKETRTARFRTVIALIQDGKETLFEGICPGFIAEEKRGDSDFGYDPVFVPEGYRETFAELGDTVKNRISHRALATGKLMKFLSGGH